MKLEAARLITPLLPGVWTAREAINPDNSILMRDDGMELLLITGWNKNGMVNVSFKRPRMEETGVLSPHGQVIFTATKAPSINISIKKTPEQTARDIISRILPNSEITYKEALEISNRTLEATKKKAANIKLMEDATGKPSYKNTISLTVTGSHGGHILTHDGDFFDISLHHLPQDKALALVEFLKTL